MQLGTDWASRGARGIFALLMLLAWGGFPQATLGADQPAPTDPATAAKLADAIDRIVKIYSDIDKDLPRDTFEPEAVISAAGKDVDALFNWVRDNTSYVPYRGVLRGARGVLMDRNGNSVDRALLLARLLQLSGQPARLAHGVLGPDRAEALLKQTWESAKTAALQNPDGAPANDAEITKTAAQYRIDPAEVRRSYQTQQLSQEKAEEDIVGVVTEQTEALAALLGSRVVNNDSQHAQQVSAISDHWWVQIQREGKWVDLDPLTRDARIGTALTTPSETVDLAPEGTIPPPLLAVAHEVEVRVTIEGTDKSVTHQEVVFRQALKPAELAGNPVKLQIASLEWPKDLDLTHGNAGELLKAALAKQQNFIPILEINGKPLMQGSFDVHGNVNPKPNLDELSKLGGSSGGAANRARDVLDDRPPPQPSTGELTAVRVEYEIRLPGEKPRVIRRDLFDAIGPAKRATGGTGQIAMDDALRLRRAVSIYRTIYIEPLGCVLSHPYVMHLALQNVISNGPIASKAFHATAGKTLKQTLDELAPVKPLPTAVVALAASRQQQIGAGAGLAMDRPNVFTLSEGFALDASGALQQRIATDIVANEVAIRGAGGAEAFKARLAQGILETALERRALGVERRSVNTVSLFGASEAQKVPWLKLSSPDAPELAKLSLPPDALARIRADLQEGYAVVAPTSPVNIGGQTREGWWRIDPRDGSCIGFAADGTGAELVEYAIALVSILVEAGYAFRCLAHTHGEISCIGCFCISAVVDMASLLLHVPAGQGLKFAAAVAGASWDLGRLCEAATE